MLPQSFVRPWDCSCLIWAMKFSAISTWIDLIWWPLFNWWCETGMWKEKQGIWSQTASPSYYPFTLGKCFNLSQSCFLIFRVVLKIVEQSCLLDKIKFQSLAYSLCLGNIKSSHVYLCFSAFLKSSVGVAIPCCKLFILKIIWPSAQSL